MIRATVLLVLAAAACSPGAFDDRRADAWADSNGAENVSSTEYGLAVAGVTTESLGATVVGLGLDPVGLGVLQYDEDGSLAIGGGDIPDVGSGSLDGTPTLVAAPGPVPGAAGLVALGGLGELDEILFIDVSSGTPAVVGSVSGQDCGAPGENLGHAMFLAQTSAGELDAVDLVAARGNELFLFEDVEFDEDGSFAACYRCVAAGMGIPNTPITALAAYDLGVPDGQEIMLANGTLAAFDAAQVQEASDEGVSCFAIRSVFSGFGPGGDAIAIATGDAADDGFPDLAVTSARDDAVYYYPNLTNSGPGGATQMLIAAGATSQFGTSLVFADIDGVDGDELIVGDPGSSTPEGIAGAGQVAIYAYSESEEELEQRATIYDSTPEQGQQFGRALSEAEFVFGQDDADILIVGAVDEIFTYFRVLPEGSDPR